MISAALIFVAALTLFFAWLAVFALLSGRVRYHRLTSRLWTDDRGTTPVAYWIDVGTMILVAAAGVAGCLWLLTRPGQ